MNGAGVLIYGIVIRNQVISNTNINESKLNETGMALCNILHNKSSKAVSFLMENFGPAKSKSFFSQRIGDWNVPFSIISHSERNYFYKPLFNSQLEDETINSKSTFRDFILRIIFKMSSGLKSGIVF